MQCMPLIKQYLLRKPFVACRNAWGGKWAVLLVWNEGGGVGQSEWGVGLLVWNEGGGAVRVGSGAIGVE